MQHFHVDLDDPTRFDLVVNTARLGVAGQRRRDPGRRRAAGGSRAASR